MCCAVPPPLGREMLYGPDGEMAVPLLPKRALELAQELLTRGVQAIKADWPGWRRSAPRAGSHTIKFR